MNGRARTKRSLSTAVGVIVVAMATLAPGASRAATRTG